jgi:alpha-glucosidase
LPMGQGHLEAAVDVQDDDPESVLNFTRRLLEVRGAHASLTAGDIAFEDAEASLLAFRRSYGDETLFCLFNLGQSPQPRPACMPTNAAVLLTSGWGAGDVGGYVPEYSVWIGRA